MAQPPALSVCIRGFRPDRVGTAIASALAQTRGDLEVVVADDAGTLEPAVAAFSDPRVRYVRNGSRLGPALNSRAVVAASRGRRVVILGDDDALLPEFAARTLAVFESRPSAGVVFTDYVSDDGHRRKVRPAPVPAGVLADPLPTCLSGEFPMLSSAVVRREAWEAGERALPLTDGVATDLVLFVRSAELGCEFVRVAEPLVVVDAGPGRISTSLSAIDMAVHSYRRFAFSNPHHEGLRRRHLATCLQDRSRAELWYGDPADAAAPLREAVRLGGRDTRQRALELLARRPALIPLARPAWHAAKRSTPAGVRRWVRRRRLTRA